MELPVEVEGRIVRLVQLNRRHTADLQTNCGHPDVWRFQYESWHNLLRGGLPAVIDFLVGEDLAGRARAYAIESTDGVIGIIRVMFSDDSFFIASTATWIGKPWFKTGVNREAKLLVLRSFFSAGGQTMSFLVDVDNDRSVESMQKIGVPRTERRTEYWTRGGVATDVYVFEITSKDWPAVEATLEAQLQDHRPLRWSADFD